MGRRLTWETIGALVALGGFLTLPMASQAGTLPRASAPTIARLVARPGNPGVPVRSGAATAALIRLAADAGALEARSATQDDRRSAAAGLARRSVARRNSDELARVLNRPIRTPAGLRARIGWSSRLPPREDSLNRVGKADLTWQGPYAALYYRF